MKKTALIMLIVLLFGSVAPVFAQGNPYVIDSTRPISGELRAWLDAWLAVDAPSLAPFYIVTYTEERGDDVLVSLVGVDLETPESSWSLEDGAVWIGTVVVDETTGQVSPFSMDPGQAHAAKRAAMRTAGGGSYVAFPFQQGTSALYGPRGVHGSGDYGTSGMLFVDLVSGDDMGATAAPPNVYASDDGEIDYVCDDGVTVAVRTHNATTGDYFLYAHLLDNASLTMSTEFSQGEMIGTLKYGSFEGGNPSCGWAEQHANHYHVHWGFVPSGGKYQVGACILTVSTQVWQCGDEAVRIGGYLVGGGGFSGNGNSSGTSGAGSAVTDPTFFDYILLGVVGLLQRNVFDLLPSHQSFQYVDALLGTVEMFFRVTYVLVQSNLALGFTIPVLLSAVLFKLTLSVIGFVPLFFRAFKWLFPGA